MPFTPANPAMAEVRLVGEPPNQQFEFYIPAGAKGDPGVSGPANVLTIGTVTTGATGTNASATITGTAPVQTLNLTLPRGATGDGSAYEMRGTGMPNGVVAASPGTYYTDDAGTNGAWRWLKKSGTGNTGWSPIHADTGLRDVSTLVNVGGHGTGGLALIHLRRVENTVSVIGAKMTLPAGKTIGGYNLPVGFRPSYGVNVSSDLHVDTTAAHLGRAIVRDGTTGEQYKITFWSMEARSWMIFNMSYETPDAWPTTLPGNPA